MSAWISRSGALTQAETLNNAQLFYNQFNTLGYSLETISALAGNAEAESGINPEREEAGGGGGYGIFQWTPKSDLQTACSQLGLSPYTDGDVQCKCLDGELFTLRNQWYTTSAFISPYYNSGATTDMIGVTPEQFKTNSLGWNADKLAVMFMVGYERPSYDPDTNHSALRQQLALKWYEYFSGHPPTPPTPTKKHKMPIYFYCLRKKR